MTNQAELSNMINVWMHPLFKTTVTLFAWFVFVSFLAANLFALLPVPDVISTFGPASCGAAAACVIKFAM